MLDGWGEHPAVRHTLAEASEALSCDLGRLVRELGERLDPLLEERARPRRREVHVLEEDPVACARTNVHTRAHTETHTQ